MSSSDDRRRPRVAGHRRRTAGPGRPVPVDPVEQPLTSTDAVPDAPSAATARPSSPGQGGADAVADTPAPRRGGHGLRRDVVVPAVSLVLSLLVLGLVGWVSLGDPGARARDARAATAAARADLEQLLSYDHQTIAVQATRNAALLTGSFKDEYATTMRTKIAPVAEQEKAVVRARTYEAGVMSQGEDTVTVQVFLNQAKTARGQDSPSVDQNRVIATMRRVDGRWLLARLSAY